MAKKPAKPIRQNLAPRKAAFLAAYAACGNVTGAAEAAKIDRRTHYDWMRDDAAYKASFRSAHSTAIDALEKEARRRATQGVQRLKFHEGQMVMIPDPYGAVVEGPDGKEVPAMVPYVENLYSDTLLIFLLKAGRPRKFRDNAFVEHKGDLAVKLTGENAPMPTREEALKIHLELSKQLPAKAK